VTTIAYAGDDRATPVVDPAMTILDVSIAHKIPHFRECGGHGRCTTCRVRILDGIQHVSPRTARETEVAEALRWDRFTRLACQTRVSGDVVLERLIKSGADVSRLQLEEASLARRRRSSSRSSSATSANSPRSSISTSRTTWCTSSTASSRPSATRSW
jgi:ferredoxin